MQCSELGCGGLQGVPHRVCARLGPYRLAAIRGRVAVQAKGASTPCDAYRGATAPDTRQVSSEESARGKRVRGVRSVIAFSHAGGCC